MTTPEPRIPLDVKRRSYGLALALIVGIALVAVAKATPPEAGTAEHYAREFGGSVEAYDEILHELSCGWLREAFDLASQREAGATPGSPDERLNRGLMIATADRMETVGCPEPSAPRAVTATTDSHASAERGTVCVRATMTVANAE